MLRHVFLGSLVLLFLTACSSESENADSGAGDNAGQAAMLPSADDVAAAMGLEGVNSLTLSGEAWRIRNSFRQTMTASPPWPERDEVSNWTLTMDFGDPALLGTGDTFSSNLFLEPPVAGTHTVNVPAGTDAWNRQMEIWLTPWGFIKGAQMYGAQVSGDTGDVEAAARITWMSPESITSPSGMRYTVNGYINAENQVVRTETWVDDAFMGDMHVVGIYDDYRALNGIMVPASFEQQRGGGGVFGGMYTGATANPDNLAALMEAPPAGPGFAGGPGNGEPPGDLTEDLGDGAWLVKTPYVALVVEFTDHLAVFEAGASPAVGEMIVQQIRDYISDKEIRYIINSHPHSDHTGGLVPLIREGAALVTHENNVAFLDMALNTSRDLLGEPPLNAEVMGVSGVGVFEDEMNRLELHPVPNLHTDGMLVALLPKQGVLFEADFTLPQPGAQANPFVLTLAEYVADNDLQFERYLAVHPASVAQSRDDLMATIGQ